MSIDEAIFRNFSDVTGWDREKLALLFNGVDGYTLFVEGSTYVSQRDLESFFRMLGVIDWEVAGTPLKDEKSGFALHFRVKKAKPTPWSETYAIDEARRLIPSSCAQRQDSTTDQLTTVLELARRAGCYDAHDFLKDVLRVSRFQGIQAENHKQRD